jgi:hypothetical protein
MPDTDQTELFAAIASKYASLQQANPEIELELDTLDSRLESGEDVLADLRALESKLDGLLAAKNESNESAPQEAADKDVADLPTKTEALFQELYAQGKDKNAIIIAIANLLANNVTAAVREYTRIVREQGLVMAPKERAEKLEVAFAMLEIDWQDSDTRAALALTVADEYDISVPTATQHIRDYCEAHGIEIPSVQRTSFDDLKAFVLKDRDAGAERAETIKKLVSEFGYTDNSAASAYSRVLREAGVTTARASSKVDLSTLVTLMRKNLSKGKKTAINIVAAETGYSKITMAAFFNYVPLAQEWHAQELAALQADAAAAETELESSGGA